MQTQPEVLKSPATKSPAMKSPAMKKRGKGTCRKCWHALGESESCKTCGEVYARVEWLICAAVLVSMVVAGGLYSML